jgi:hypothetical protein
MHVSLSATQCVVMLDHHAFLIVMDESLSLLMLARFLLVFISLCSVYFAELSFC